MQLKVNYPEVGATRGEAMPSGYRHLQRVGVVAAPLADAAEFLMTWGLHERCGLHPRSEAPRAAPGVEVDLQFARMRIPCQVVWVEETPERAGCAYGSLEGHPERGEAAFILEPLGPDRCRFTVKSFSRPGHWISRLGGPIARELQSRATDQFLQQMKSHFAKS